MLVIYGGQVMTDVPSVLFTATALLIHLRGLNQRRVGLILAGAVVLGLGVNLRETVAFYLPWLVIAPFVAGFKFNRRTIGIVGLSLAVFFICAFGPFAIWFAASPSYRADWYVWLYSTQAEAARHPIAVANLRPFLIYFFLASPLIFMALPFAVWKEWRERGLTLSLTAALAGLSATAMLFLNYSTTINWRYFLTGLPALAPLAGDYFLRTQTKRFGTEGRGFVSAIIGIALVAFFMGVLIQPKSNEYFNRLAQARTYDSQLRLMPRDAVVIAGAQTVAVQYWRGIGLGEWDWIGVGAGWPQGQLESKIDEHLKAGRRVFSTPIRAGGCRVRGALAKSRNWRRSNRTFISNKSRRRFTRFGRWKINQRQIDLIWRICCLRRDRKKLSNVLIQDDFAVRRGDRDDGVFDNVGGGKRDIDILKRHRESPFVSNV